MHYFYIIHYVTQLASRDVEMEIFKVHIKFAYL